MHTARQKIAELLESTGRHQKAGHTFDVFFDLFNHAQCDCHCIRVGCFVSGSV